MYSYDSIDLRKYLDSKDKNSYLLCSSFRSIYNRNSQIRVLSIEDNTLKEKILYEWGININQTSSGEEYTPYYYIYNDNQESIEISEEDFYEYINELKLL